MSDIQAQDVATHAETAPVVHAEQIDKAVPQSKVNELIGVAMAKGHQKGYQQAQAELTSHAPVTPPVQSMGGMHQIDQGEIDRRVADAYAKAHADNQAEVLRQQQKAHGEKVINSLMSKVAEAQQRIPDYDAVTSRIDFTKFPVVLHMADKVDNSGDILYHLAQEPAKMSTLTHLASLDPGSAQVEMKKLSDSLKRNQEAEGRPAPREPLNSIKPSNVGIGKKPQTAAEWRHFHRANHRR